MCTAVFCCVLTEAEEIVEILLKDVMHEKLFQRCTHLLYCSVLSLGGNVNTRQMSQPDMGSIFQTKNQWNILVIGNYYVNYQNFQNVMLLTSSDTKRTLIHLFLFTKSAQIELVSICTQSVHDRNKLALPYILDQDAISNVYIHNKGMLQVYS